MPLRKVHELAFLWFVLPGPLLRGDHLNRCFAPWHNSGSERLEDGSFKVKTVVNRDSVGQATLDNLRFWTSSLGWAITKARSIFLCQATPMTLTELDLVSNPFRLERL